MVNRQDVIQAYRLFLGREPESDAAIAAHLGAASVADLGAHFVRSEEFRARFASTFEDVERCMPVQTLPPMRVDVEAEPADLERLLARIRSEWEEFGRTEPHWSVLTHENFKQQELASNRDAFFGSGEFVADIAKTFFARQGMTIPVDGRCLELGCGVGRITLHLARMFRSVVGVDISKFHLEVCAEELRRQRVSNVELVCLDRPETLRDLQPFEFFCSFIVLQHNPPPAMAFLLDTLLAKLTPGGVGIFQVPTYRKGYRFDVRKYLDRAQPLHMEMHVLPQREVFRIIERQGCRLVEVREDGWAEGRTTSGLSNTFFVVKQ